MSIIETVEVKIKTNQTTNEANKWKTEEKKYFWIKLTVNAVISAEASKYNEPASNSQQQQEQNNKRKKRRKIFATMRGRNEEKWYARKTFNVYQYRIIFVVNNSEKKKR